MLRPTFRSVAALAGWDEESLLIASFDAQLSTDRSDPLWKSLQQIQKGIISIFFSIEFHKTELLLLF